VTGADDITVCVVKNFGWDRFRVYANSLVRSGFSGTKFILADNLSDEALDNLRRLGFVIIGAVVHQTEGYRQRPHHAKPDDWDYPAFIEARHTPVIDLLKVCSESRYVIYTDMGDVVFQTNPSVWLEQHCGLDQTVAAAEGWLLKNAGSNDGWLRRANSDYVYRWLREKETLCGGTISGGTNAVLNLLTAMRYVLQNNKELIIDQSALNYVLRLSPFVEKNLIPTNQDGFIATVGNYLVNSKRLWTDVSPVLKDGIVYTPDGHMPFCVVHQYNRNKYWKESIEGRYQ
jgi:hypothetical protein